MNCPHCQQILPYDYSTAYCPFCGKDFPKDFPIEQTALRAPDQTPGKKWKKRFAFWLVFLGSPLLGLILGLMGLEWPAWLLVPLVGALHSGYALGKVFSKSLGGLFLGTVLVTLGVLVMYAVIIFVGAEVIFWNLRWE